MLDIFGDDFTTGEAQQRRQDRGDRQRFFNSGTSWASVCQWMKPTTARFDNKASNPASSAIRSVVGTFGYVQPQAASM